jgi:hypothetical protein
MVISCVLGPDFFDLTLWSIWRSLSQSLATMYISAQGIQHNQKPGTFSPKQTFTCKQNKLHSFPIQPIHMTRDGIRWHCRCLLGRDFLQMAACSWGRKSRSPTNCRHYTGQPFPAKELQSISYLLPHSHRTQDPSESRMCRCWELNIE